MSETADEEIQFQRQHSVLLVDRIRALEAELADLKALAKREIPNSAAICPICLSEMVCLTPHKHFREARR